MPKTLNINGEECYLEKLHYSQGGRLAIELQCADGSGPFCVATINAPEVRLGPDEIILKNRDGQDAAIQALMEAGIVSKPVRHVQLGWVSEPVVRVNESVLAEYTAGELEQNSAGESV